MKNWSSILIRAQEIRNPHLETGRITVHEVAAKIYAEMKEAGDEVAIDNIAEGISKASKVPPTLPEQVQGELWNTPEWVTVQTKEGPEFVMGEKLKTHEAEAIVDYGVRHHSAQAERYKRARRDIKVVKDWEGFNPDLPYNQNARNCVAALASTERVQELLGGGE